jgi:hypothetical protein
MITHLQIKSTLEHEEEQETQNNIDGSCWYWKINGIDVISNKNIYTK